MSDFVIENDVLKEYKGNAGDVVVPDGVKEIASFVFMNAEAESISLPATATKLGTQTFLNCRNLKNIIVSADNKNYFSEDGVLFSKDKKTLIKYPAGRQGGYIIPDSVKKIRNEAFYGCSCLTEVIIPDSVEQIGKYAFSACKSLRNLEIDPKIAMNACIADNISIDRYFIPYADINRFEPNEKLCYAVYFLTSAEKHSDKNKEVYLSYIKKQIRKITETVIEHQIITALSALVSMKLLTIKDIDVYIEIANKSGKQDALAMLMDYKNNSFSPVDVEKEETRKIKKELNYDPTSLTALKAIWSYDVLPDDTIIIKSYKGNETEITVPEFIGKKKVTVLDANVFSTHKKMIKNKDVREAITSVTIPSDVTEIGWAAFSGCKNLKRLELSEKVGKIEDFAFSNCDNLTIHAPSGSYAELYAKENNIKFESIK